MIFRRRYARSRRSPTARSTLGLDAYIVASLRPAFSLCLRTYILARRETMTYQARTFHSSYALYNINLDSNLHAGVYHAILRTSSLRAVALVPGILPAQHWVRARQVDGWPLV